MRSTFIHPLKADRAKLKVAILLSSSIEKIMQCELCDRQMEALTAHHLIPKQNTKRKNEDPSPTIDICSACHRQIHSLFENKHLAQELNTLEKLKNNPELQKFVSWIKKQKTDKRIQVRGKKARSQGHNSYI
ncbi:MULTISPECIES: HNH endonuclease [unclassified Microcoleus]|uniref:HNH endonuclease n=1 Tax=unclassified Microcoleus TaxID=2642155 RepID=UPI002FD2A569